MNSEESINVSQSTIFQEILQGVYYTRSQNETIIQNQAIINSKLQTLLEHFELKMKEEWSITNSDFYNGSSKITQDNFKSLYSDLREYLKTKSV